MASNFRDTSAKPTVGTKLTDNGIVTSHKVSPYGLHELKVEMFEGYPSLEAWTKMIGSSALYHSFGEKREHGFVGMLTLFWKISEGEQNV